MNMRYVVHNHFPARDVEKRVYNKTHLANMANRGQPSCKNSFAAVGHGASVAKLLDFVTKFPKEERCIACERLAKEQVLRKCKERGLNPEETSQVLKARSLDTLSTDVEFIEAWDRAQVLDSLRYANGLARIAFVRDTDQWNAAYLPATDTIEIQDKFHAKTFGDKVQTLLHELGHRGQMRVDKRTFARLKALGLSKTSSFLAMANRVHREDYAKNGIAPSVMADEIYAESYARFSLGMDMPDELRRFWTERVSQ